MNKIKLYILMSLLAQVCCANIICAQDKKKNNLEHYEDELNNKAEEATKKLVADMKAADENGDYKLAFECAERIRALKDSIYRTQTDVIVGNLSEEIEKNRLTREDDARKLEMTNIKLEQIKMENEQIALQNEAIKLDENAKAKDAQNQRLRINNKEKAEELEKFEAEKKATEAQAQKKQARLTIIVLALAVILLTVIVVGLMINSHRRKKTLSKLTKSTNDLMTARNNAIRANRMKNIFIQNMSHEIRTPLNAVMGFAQILGSPELVLTDDERSEYNAHIRNNARMLTMLIDDILNINDIETGNYSIRLRGCRINEVLQAAVSSAEFRVNEGVRLYMTSEVDDDYMAVMDSRRVQQVLINFLTNACKHTERGSIHLNCSLMENPGMLTFSVADTGSGIPKEQAETIFERFTKLDDFKQGTGLGLNICRLISKRLNGFVKCDTNYTNGARFVFAIPNIRPGQQHFTN